MMSRFVRALVRGNSLETVGRRFASTQVKQKKIGVLSIPFCQGQPKPGTEQGPEVLRATGFLDQLIDIGVDVKDYGTVDFSKIPEETEEISNGKTTLKNTTAVGLGNLMISDSVSKILRDGRFSLNLGGDHSMGIGTVHGASEVYRDLNVIWVDAHADINTAATTNSGNYHGMPLSFLVEELQPYVMKIPQFSWIKHKIKAKNLYFIGLRDVEPYERAIIQMLGINAFSMKEVSTLGIEKVMEIVMDKIEGRGRGKRSIHLSFDIDVLDDTVAVSTGTPVAGGLTVREGLTIVEQLHRDGNVVSMDMVEVNPMLGNAADVDRTVKAARHVLVNALGYYRGGVAMLNSAPVNLKPTADYKYEAVTSISSSS